MPAYRYVPPRVVALEGADVNECRPMPGTAPTAVEAAGQVNQDRPRPRPVPTKRGAPHLAMRRTDSRLQKADRGGADR
ncbi:hypothetical protein GCM10010172_78290 [Paractinoplanes ferrugineus]|uniref:Uncharacterized protein n=1 Tax=Paractinoplanes ferrugineus TaxID=113564 RepID=A0A919MM56_9ACTN|nr:hypothetical protein Afe05nite_47420 [Actinoplanes ferrugineus]